MGVSKASLRGLPIDQRLQKMGEAAAKERKTVRVTPTSDAMRTILVHPHGGGFPKDGPAEWPDDGFTLRRVQDGDVKIEGQEEQQHVQQSQGQSRGG